MQQQPALRLAEGRLTSALVSSLELKSQKGTAWVFLSTSAYDCVCSLVLVLFFSMKKHSIKTESISLVCGIKRQLAVNVRSSWKIFLNILYAEG